MGQNLNQVMIDASMMHAARMSAVPYVSGPIRSNHVVWEMWEFASQSTLRYRVVT